MCDSSPSLITNDANCQKLRWGLFAEKIVTTIQLLYASRTRYETNFFIFLLIHVVSFSHAVLCFFGFHPNCFPFWAPVSSPFSPGASLCLLDFFTCTLTIRVHVNAFHRVRNSFGFHRLRLPFWFQSPRIFASSSRCLPCSLTHHHLYVLSLSRRRGSPQNSPQKKSIEGTAAKPRKTGKQHRQEERCERSSAKKIWKPTTLLYGLPS